MCVCAGSVGVNIPKMMAMHMTGFEYQVEKDCYVRTQIATVTIHPSLLIGSIVHHLKSTYLTRN